MRGGGGAVTLLIFCVAAVVAGVRGVRVLTCQRSLLRGEHEKDESIITIMPWCDLCGWVVTAHPVATTTTAATTTTTTSNDLSEFTHK